MTGDLSWDGLRRGPMPEEGRALYEAYWSAQDPLTEKAALNALQDFLRRHPGKSPGQFLMDAILRAALMSPRAKDEIVEDLISVLRRLPRDLTVGDLLAELEES